MNINKVALSVSAWYYGFAFATLERCRDLLHFQVAGECLSLCEVALPKGMIYIIYIWASFQENTDKLHVKLHSDGITYDCAQHDNICYNIKEREKQSETE